MTDISSHQLTSTQSNQSPVKVPAPYQEDGIIKKSTTFGAQTIEEQELQYQEFIRNEQAIEQQQKKESSRRKIRPLTSEQPSMEPHSKTSMGRSGTPLQTRAQSKRDLRAGLPPIHKNARLDTPKRKVVKEYLTNMSRSNAKSAKDIRVTPASESRRLRSS